ncbi:DUF3285 domain-containing protein [Kovacikia minuta CCNUW1]|nr:DUF3285 domain-containing protein [Kovacikia minuta CCNUW1]
MQDSASETVAGSEATQTVAGSDATPTEPQPSYVKLAMRNMVRKRGTSLKHFVLTTLGLLGILIGLSYLTR